MDVQLLHGVCTKKRGVGAGDVTHCVIVAHKVAKKHQFCR